MDVPGTDGNNPKGQEKHSGCRIIFFVNDENDIGLSENVRQAKRDGFIDAFLFGSVSENYFASVIDSI